MSSPRFFQQSYFDNLGCALAAGTFTIQGADGRALSTSNPAIVVLPSRGTPGQFTEYQVTANQNFIDDAGASEIINNLFGLPTGVAYGEDIPFFIYAVTNDAETLIQFMISRVHDLTSSPTNATDIGAPDDAVADSQASFWSLDNIAESLYNGNPCLMVGSFRMQFSALDDWTIQTLDTADGFGKYQYERDFTFPLAVFGASAGTYIIPNGGTAPVFSDLQYLYRVLPGGMCNIQCRQNNDGGTDGVGSANSLVSCPYVIEGDSSKVMGSCVIQGGSITSQVSTTQKSSTANAFFFRGLGGAIVDQQDFSNGDRRFTFDATFKLETTP